MSVEPSKQASGGAGMPSESDGWKLFSTLIAGVLVWGGIGWGLDELLGFRALFLPIGSVLGVAGAVYLIVVKTRQV
ncbi:AtpZ/AtpI family protein [Nocardiopsis flavescens]|uniref:ATP synthase protein I n=1 Tax=Nocardiopsis flavescens TaxID=758803 RepID=A0A1M6K690_9ACTN|nr:AtpZ/AtpI family protein [Nocardiopsis flavescens]SHJ54488.1 ATP synthase protein I [Nocardiopsis flavescens]